MDTFGQGVFDLAVEMRVLVEVLEPGDAAVDGVAHSARLGRQQLFLEVLFALEQFLLVHEEEGFQLFDPLELHVVGRDAVLVDERQQAQVLRLQVSDELVSFVLVHGRIQLDLLGLVRVALIVN